MRIGISTSVIQRGKTGIGQYLFALLRAMLPRLGEHQLTLFVLEEDLPLFEFLGKRVELVSVPESARPPLKNILWHQTTLPHMIKGHRVDVLHVPSYRRMLWRKPCPLVATIHDLAPFQVKGKYDWKRMFYGKVVARRLARRQDFVIAISENTARDIARYFRLSSEKLAVIYNGLEHDRFFPGSRAQARTLIERRYSLNRPFFLYVARLEHPGKNHLRLISAFEEFKAATQADWQLVFAGSDWLGAEVIHDAIRRSAFANDIRCLGFVADEGLPDLYRAADVFVYPSLYEGFGMPPLEAMACGCPVIASARGSLGEVLGQAAALIEPEDIHTIARELFLLATDPSRRNQFRAAGLAQAGKFNWANTASKTLELYQRAIEAHGS
jgi:glycosyltransferase involved in cell wall biosynthesis